MPFLASYLIYHFTVSVVNNHTETSSVCLEAFLPFSVLSVGSWSPAGVSLGL